MFSKSKAAKQPDSSPEICTAVMGDYIVGNDSAVGWRTFLLVGRRSNEIMTTFFSQDVSCANCHKSSQHDVLGSTSVFGRPDLDLRPAEMQRSTMEVWLQVCPHCRYIAPDLAQQVGDLSVVATAEYRTTLDDQRFLELARRFSHTRS